MEYFELDEIPKDGHAPEYDYSGEPLQTTLPHTAPLGASRLRMILPI
jgi:hypothetical protein